MQTLLQWSDATIFIFLTRTGTLQTKSPVKERLSLGSMALTIGNNRVHTERDWLPLGSGLGQPLKRDWQLISQMVVVREGWTAASGRFRPWPECFVAMMLFQSVLDSHISSIISSWRKRKENKMISEGKDGKGHQSKLKCAPKRDSGELDEAQRHEHNQNSLLSVTQTHI